jgi:branched-subunit amino acid ABC-type transport system permease component
MTAVGLRRIFLAGVALTLTGAATAAIVAVLRGELSETEGGVILALVGVFLSGAAATAGLELLIRRRRAPLGVAVLVAAAGELSLLEASSRSSPRAHSREPRSQGRSSTATRTTSPRGRHSPCSRS